MSISRIHNIFYFKTTDTKWNKLIDALFDIKWAYSCHVFNVFISQHPSSKELNKSLISNKLFKMDHTEFLSRCSISDLDFYAKCISHNK